MKSAYNTLFHLTPVPSVCTSPVNLSPATSSSPRSNVWLSTPPPTDSADRSIPICSAGFTYCGYILRDHQHFHEQDIIQTYCAADTNNCVHGRTRTDPLQALYVCVPPGAADNPRRDPAASANPKDGTGPTTPRDHPPLDNNNNNNNNNNVETRLLNPMNKPPGHAQDDQPQPPSATPPPSSDEPSSSSSSNNALPGNKIELLCSCSGQCLNPLRDHIGRCDMPCS
ncbi:hypothetical protein BT67DRAFT_438949 [Trichocladium antarcticum]|uniref:Uncharacterized protein n=1 Tax=Trichocladium antarcticum TaxID=1450529 RepID=A0AAN6UR61_9PEZI|nr:hypothetical protein BT67DRAFT_438949 [Trichocladium antarcticum]